MKMIRKYLSKFLYILACLNIVSINIVSASPMSQSDINALGNWTNWVAAQCNSSGSISGNIPAGNGAPTGLSFPNLDPNGMATAIDAFITKTNNSSLMSLCG